MNTRILNDEIVNDHNGCSLFASEIYESIAEEMRNQLIDGEHDGFEFSIKAFDESGPVGCFCSPKQARPDPDIASDWSELTDFVAIPKWLYRAWIETLDTGAKIMDGGAKIMDGAE